MKLLRKKSDYKSKTEVRLAYIISFNRNQKARVRYITNPNPTVKKEL
jgi:hypothetical protein